MISFVQVLKSGSMYAIHAIWTAAKYRIPVIFVCFVNHEYRILKNLWCHFKQTQLETTQFIGMDLNDPQIDVLSIAKAFGAVTATVKKVEDVEGVLSEAFKHQGPTFITVLPS